jgi:hypothetical protein
MKLDPDVRATLAKLTVPYTIEKSKNHYYVRMENHPRIIIAGNHGRLSIPELRITLRKLNKIINGG